MLLVGYSEILLLFWKRFVVECDCISPHYQLVFWIKFQWPTRGQLRGDVFFVSFQDIVLFRNFIKTHFLQYVFILSVSNCHPSLPRSLNGCFILKETCNSFQRWPLKLSWIASKSLIEVGNITKAATFKSFLHLSYKNTQILFLWQCFLIFSWDKH